MGEPTVGSFCVSVPYDPEYGNNVMIGLDAGRSLVRGKGNIFLGTEAGKELTEANNLLCVRAGDTELRLDMTDRESLVLRTFLQHLLRNWLPGIYEDSIVNELRLLTDEQRMAIFGKFCTACGKAELPCYCTRDD